MTRKKCTKCGRCKAVSAFSLGRKYRDGYNIHCKLCVKKYRKVWYRENLDDIKVRQRAHDLRRRLTLGGWAYSTHRDIIKRKHSCSITQRDLVALFKHQGGKCAVSGCTMDFTAAPRHPSRPSVDRLDNGLGYHIGNVRLVILFVNQARNTMADADLIQYCWCVAMNHQYAKPTGVESLVSLVAGEREFLVSGQCARNQGAEG